MFNLCAILISLCINFAAVDFPVDYTFVNTEYLSQVQDYWQQLLSYGYNVDLQYMIVEKRNNNSAPYSVWYPAEVFNSSQSSISISSRNDTSINITSTNWARWLVYSDGSVQSSYSINNLGTKGFIIDNTPTTSNYIIYNAYYTLPLNGIDTFNWQHEVVPIGSGSGSLGSTGHSSGGSPIDELNNNGVTWSTIQGTFTSTGHSIQNVTTPPSADPNSNLELILSGFLGGILNNTNNLLGNTSQLGSILGGVSNNVIQGSSAIFNSISNLNNTIMEFIAYIREPLDQDRISAKLEEVPIYQTINSLVGFSDSFLSAINSVQDPEHLYLTMDFRNANEPFRRLGLYVFDFTFLDNLKSTWQPILLAVLYVTLGVNIFYDLPNIVHGISGLSGGDE